jgi:hypothetical protein
MEGFSFVTPITGLNRPNTGKEDDDGDAVSHKQYLHIVAVVFSTVCLLQELVHCFTEQKPHASVRHHYIFCSHLPPHWKVETELADLLVSLGVVKSALDIFLRLQLWEKVIMCYNLLNLRHKVKQTCFCKMLCKIVCIALYRGVC